MAFSESFDSFVAPAESKPVPNHLLDTSEPIIHHFQWHSLLTRGKITFLSWCTSTLSFSEIYAKIGQNSVLKTKPTVVHFAGFQVGKKQTQILVRLVVLFSAGTACEVITNALKHDNKGGPKFIPVLVSEYCSYDNKTINEYFVFYV